MTPANVTPEQRAATLSIRERIAERKRKPAALFACLECGRKFRSVRAAERAAFGDAGCPGCGGSDIDIA